MEPISTINSCYKEQCSFPSYTQEKDIFGEVTEDPNYLNHQLITYIGNKRSLLPEIENVVIKVKSRLKKDKIRIMDAFSGSGSVSRLFKKHSSYLITIDLEDYAAVVARCYLCNKSSINQNTLCSLINELNQKVDSVDYPIGFIEELYSPKDENNITPEDRVFYTKRNARRIDNYRRLINTLPLEYQDLVLGPLLSESSIHANTSGVFKGFYKNKYTKIGQFGGTNGDALSRILGEIKLTPPILSNFECEVKVLQGDANELAPQEKNLDLVYLDPPYNQHPYGSNYFMLNLIVNYKRPQAISKVSGIPDNWRKSKYNNRSEAKTCFQKLVENLDSKFILISFNNEGFIKQEEMLSMLEKLGHVEVFEKKYNTFRGCRNLHKRNIHVTEQLFLLARQ
ncbi:MAG TPA: DNA adenine methylase [Anaerohalosphaeraceae bacterium]|nr:DNA adenine methylase [Anaerohalosphaeraceae bacterium]HOL88846.1 DNA adenine methylase [Anaerohalosphaeraceae bacterium]HPP55644.1 DNA adenine methylase [Anaerohalosphaeraceae bacterium]